MLNRATLSSEAPRRRDDLGADVHAEGRIPDWRNGARMRVWSLVPQPRHESGDVGAVVFAMGDSGAGRRNAALFEESLRPPGARGGIVMVHNKTRLDLNIPTAWRGSTPPFSTGHGGTA